MAKQLEQVIQTPNYQQIKQNFLQELTLASEEKPSSISFIKSVLPKKQLLKNGTVQGIVIGGTNYILSTEKITQTKPNEILERKTGILSTFTTKERFINFLLEHLDQRADAIGINFGFPLNQTYGKDGALDGTILAKGVKDHTFSGFTEPIGVLTKTVFAERYHKQIVVSVANDTVSMLLSGNGKEQASLVAGTGFNVCLRLDRTTLVNLEAGGFSHFNHSEILKAIDAQTKNPGRKLFEKNVSGMYLPKHFNVWAKHLGLITPPVLTGQELTAIAHAYHDESARDLARIVLTQSAGLISAALAGIYEFCINQRIVQRASAFEIIGEGGLLWDGWHFYQDIQKYLTVLGIPPNTIMIKQIKDSSIKGAICLITK